MAGNLFGGIRAQLKEELDGSRGSSEILNVSPFAHSKMLLCSAGFWSKAEAWDLWEVFLLPLL